MEIQGKVRKYLNNTKWYHATTLDNWDSICTQGILVDFNKDTSDALDFGYGFYLTPTQERAESYITNLLKAGVLAEDKTPIILEFELNVLELFEDNTYNAKILNAYDDEFAIFIFENRTENKRGICQHDFDIIFGVMSDRIPMQVIADYKMNKITKDEAIELLKKPTSMKQLSLHNQDICDIMQLNKAYMLDNETSERRELNIDDYGK